MVITLQPLYPRIRRKSLQENPARRGKMHVKACSAETSVTELRNVQAGILNDWCNEDDEEEEEEEEEDDGD